MNRYSISLEEWHKDNSGNWKQLYYKYFIYKSFFNNSTIKDIKEFVKDECIKINEPICTCFLSIYKTGDDNFIYETDYLDSTYLTNTVFNRYNMIHVCIMKGRICNCGQFEKIKMYSNLMKKNEDDRKNFEEKSRKEREYFDSIIRNQNYQHQNEINRLQNFISQQRQETQRQIQNQNVQHQQEINRYQQILNEQKEQMKLEQKQNNEKFTKLEKEREIEKKENEEKLKNIENERLLEKEANDRKFQNIEI